MAVRPRLRTRLASEENPRLARDLREHWRADVAFGPGAADQLAELIDTRALIANPCVDRGIGVVPEVAMRRNIHPAVRFVPLRGAPPSPVALVFRPRAHDAMLRRFVDIARNPGDAPE